MTKQIFHSIRLYSISVLSTALLALLFVGINATNSFAADKSEMSDPGDPAIADNDHSKKEKDQKHSNKKEKEKEKAEQKSDQKVTNANDKSPYSEDAIKAYNRGVELHQSGFLNQAVAQYKLAIQADPRMEESYSNLGVIYAAQRNYPKAKDAFTTALSLKPNRPTTLNGLGTVLYAQGHIKEAKEKWQQAIVANPNFASGYYNIGNAYENEKNLPEAITAYGKAIAISPNMADAYFRIGTIYNKEHHYAQASALLRKAIALAPDSDFIREAKRIETGLETDFVKSENAARHKKPLSAVTSSESETADLQSKPSEDKNNVEEKSKSEGELNMFIHTADEPNKETDSSTK